MSQAMVNFRMDADLKREMEDVCKKMGLTLTAAFTMFAAMVTAQKKIPFEITAETPNSETIKAIEEVRMMKKNPAIGKVYTDVDVMMKELLA